MTLTCETGSPQFILQWIIIVCSLCFSMATVGIIFYRRLTNNIFAYTIVVIQSLFVVLAAIDIVSKFIRSISVDHLDIWCKAISPIVYGIITVSAV